MKKMILFSSILMFSALLYGAIDYFAADGSSKLNGLYEPGVTNQKVEKSNSGSGRVSYANTGINQIKSENKKVVEKKSESARQVSLEKFSRAALVEIPEIDSLDIATDSSKVILTAVERMPNSNEEKKYFVNSDYKK